MYWIGIKPGNPTAAEYICVSFLIALTLSVNTRLTSTTPSLNACSAAGNLFLNPLICSFPRSTSIVNCIESFITLQFLLYTIPTTSRSLRVFSFPSAIIAATNAATVLKNSPPSMKDIARLRNGALYMVWTTVSVVTVEAMSTAWVATSSATSVAALAVLTMHSLAVSARTPAVRSGVNSHAEAAAGRDVEGGDGSSFTGCDILCLCRCCGSGGDGILCGVCSENAPLRDEHGGVANASTRTGDMIAQYTATLDLLADLVVVVVDTSVIVRRHDRASAPANNGLVLFLFL
mmetsp:Transcript_34611/g.73717  ORF Transcript_34611/g.73717 Transcript_34611/m.73717 type:complete len:290 (-) Transcript_34611:287-1156(-)